MINEKLTLSDIKPILTAILSLVLACFAGYALADSLVVKNLIVFFLFVTIASFCLCTFIFIKDDSVIYAKPVAKTTDTGSVPVSLVEATTSDAQSAELKSKVLLNACASFRKGIRDNLHKITEDQQQIKQLMRDALSVLAASFYSISANIDQQQRLIELQTNSKNKDKVPLINTQFFVISHKIKEDSGNCIRSLQFEDIASQILDHSILCIDDVEKYLSNMESLLKTLYDFDSQQTDLKIVEKQFFAELENTQESDCDNRTIIKQRDVSSYNIELF